MGVFSVFCALWHIFGVILEAFWGTLASVKPVFRAGKTLSFEFWGLPFQHLFQDLFSEGIQKAFVWILGSDLGSIWEPI